VKLADLVEGMGLEVRGDDSVEVTDICYDSRKATPGCLFFAIPGERHDGKGFVEEARSAGAVAAVLAAPSEGATVEAPVREGALTRVMADDVRRRMGPIAHRFFGDPTQRMKVAGITGTNGKTTTAYLLHHLLSTCGPAGLLGTIEYRIGAASLPAARTTPESADLARAFAAMLEQQIRSAAMEVSSHALDQGRVEGCHFSAVAFTNLSQDHLDYHYSMEGYFQAKRELFVRPEAGALRVVNADDSAGKRLISEGLADVTFGASPGTDLQLTAEEAEASGTRMGLSGMGFDGQTVTIPLIGAHNVSNAGCAAALARVLGVSADAIADALSSAPQVPGRLESVSAGQPFSVFVDYAHTPDGLANVIPAVRSVTRGRVLTVFGCGGDRDRAKRPLMGEIAARLSDVSYVTSDNPRGEDPQAIIDDILAGVRQVPGAGVEVEPDRHAAIAAAIAEARPGDTVLIAGKGHETGQTVGERVLPFDDREVARRVLAEVAIP
jgi:UDP-N-acetylmuramoyl-L-alanyl-D-glutamate--2,6-diaminopimelate ligase